MLASIIKMLSQIERDTVLSRVLLGAESLLNPVNFYEQVTNVHSGGRGVTHVTATVNTAEREAEGSTAHSSTENQF
jgi:hypothetical protein